MTIDQDIINRVLNNQGSPQEAGEVARWLRTKEGQQFLSRQLSEEVSNMTEKNIHDILTKTTWKDEGVRKTCMNIRQYQHVLGYTEYWMTEYTYNIILLAKKEPKPKA